MRSYKIWNNTSIPLIKQVRSHRQFEKHWIWNEAFLQNLLMDHGGVLRDHQSTFKDPF